MKREQTMWIGLAVLFLIAVGLVTLLTGAGEKPYSSYSTEEDGTRAAYLLLEELGFAVERNTGSAWKGEGTLVALGQDYLENVEHALILEDDYRFTNEYIRYYAADLVDMLWPYRDGPIVFEEHGRSMTPNRSRDQVPASELALADIIPLWMKISLMSLLLAVFFLMFFYGQRVGRPRPPEEFGGRAPLEGVHAMAGALQKAGVWRDCVSYYYDYCARTGAQWDRTGALQRDLGAVGTERDALRLIARIDQTIKEYRHEG